MPVNRITPGKSTPYFVPKQNKTPKIHVIHENEDWVQPLWKAFEELGIPYENWFINDGGFDLHAVPPEGIFYNRMSASSHTRGHRYAIELSAPLITWLEAHGRKVINGHQTVYTEVNKAKQYLLLKAIGIRVPDTLIANNETQLLAFAQRFQGRPFIVKPNRGGKGLGVQLFQTVKALEWQLNHSPEFVSLDGIFVIQDYITPTSKQIVRMEFIGGKFYYAVAVDTSGGFELCPADACEVENDIYPTGEQPSDMPSFRIIEDFENPDIPVLEQFLAKQKIDIAGIEYAEDEKGRRFVYDINTNTNYNSKAERALKFKYQGMKRIAEYLASELKMAYP